MNIVCYIDVCEFSSVNRSKYFGSAFIKCFNLYQENKN